MTAQEVAHEQSKMMDIEIRSIDVSGVMEMIALGLKDFRSAPKFGLFFGGVYALGGWLLFLLLLQFNLPYLIYPLAMGFALLGPFIATGLYDVSRKLEDGIPLTWSGVLGSVRGASGRDIGWMALVLAFTFVLWMDIAALLFFGFLGLGGLSNGNLLEQIFTTPSGWLFLLIGNIVGAIIAFAVFSFTAISFPMLYHRDVDFITAMVTSVRVVMKSPVASLFWAACIAILLVISMLSGLLALFIILPLVGHASWHFYRKTVGDYVRS